MKITFEGETIEDVIQDIEDMARLFKLARGPEGPSPEKVVPEVINSSTIMGGTSQKSETPPTVTKPRTPKQLENDERLRVAAKAKQAEKKAAKAPKPPMPPEVREAPPPATAESLGLLPDEIVKVRQKTIEDLQSAYANGFQKEVFELLSRFGNGAKSFRELPPDAFVPIREAIDNGALT